MLSAIVLATFVSIVYTCFVQQAYDCFPRCNVQIMRAAPLLPAVYIVLIMLVVSKFRSHLDVKGIQGVVY
jgi:hypothetical protein